MKTRKSIEVGLNTLGFSRKPTAVAIAFRIFREALRWVENEMWPFDYEKSFFIFFAEGLIFIILMQPKSPESQRSI